MGIIIVRDPVELRLYCDEAGTAATAQDGDFVTVAVALEGATDDREIEWKAWLDARGLAGNTKGRRWARRYGDGIWIELLEFLSKHGIQPIVGRSSSTSELEDAARSKIAMRGQLRAQAGLPDDEGVSARDLIWIYQMTCTVTLGAAAYAMAHVPVSRLSVWYDDLQLGPVARGVIESHIGHATGRVLANRLISQPVVGEDPEAVQAQNRLVVRRLLWPEPTFVPVGGGNLWCRMADAIAAWRRLVLAGDAAASSAWMEMNNRFSYPETDRPYLYLDLDVSSGALRLANEPWPDE